MELKWAVGFSESIASEGPWSASFKCHSRWKAAQFITATVSEIPSSAEAPSPANMYGTTLIMSHSLSPCVASHSNNQRWSQQFDYAVNKVQIRSSSFTSKIQNRFFFLLSKDTHPCVHLPLDRCLIYISPLCFITFIAGVSLHQTAFAPSAHRGVRLNRLYVQVFGG